MSSKSQSSTWDVNSIDSLWGKCEFDEDWPRESSEDLYMLENVLEKTKNKQVNTI